MSHKIKKKAEWREAIIETRKQDGDCRLATFLGLIRYYGVEVSINEMFGLGCGLDFSVMSVPAKTLKILGITGRNFAVERVFCDRVNLNCKEEISTCRPKRFFGRPFDRAILEKVSKGIPVIVNTDIYYMDYLKEKNLPHNRYHCVMLVGYNLKEKSLQVIDAMTDKIETLKMHSLVQGMHEPGQYFMEEGLWYYIENSGQEKVSFPLAAYGNAIIEQSRYMQKENGPLQQMWEMKEFLGRVYEKALRSEEKKYQSFLKLQVSAICSLVRTEDEISGTFYRRLYLRFLEEFMEKCEIKNENMEKAAELLQKDAKEWRKIAFKVRYQKDVINQTAMLMESLETIYHLEKEVFQILFQEGKNIKEEREKTE